jgi:hypothetical protein
MKSSFLIYHDSLIVLESLTDEQAGQLFKAMRAYHATGELPDDLLLKLVLMPFINQWKRDLVQFEKVCERNRLNGLKGGRPKNPVGNLGTHTNPTEPKKPEKENDKDKEKDKENENIKSTRFAAPSLDEVKEFFNANGYTIEAAIKAFTYYSEAQWRDSRGQSVKNWRQKMRGVWFRDEHKPQAQKTDASKAVYTSPSNYRPA